MLQRPGLDQELANGKYSVRAMHVSATANPWRVRRFFFSYRRPAVNGELHKDTFVVRESHVDGLSYKLVEAPSGYNNPERL